MHQLWRTSVPMVKRVPTTSRPLSPRRLLLKLLLNLLIGLMVGLMVGLLIELLTDCIPPRMNPNVWADRVVRINPKHVRVRDVRHVIADPSIYAIQCRLE